MTDAEANENENGNENAPDSVFTVAEAAERLNVTIPRLRRMLARPDFAACVQQVERRTKTGTRTSMVLPVSVLVSLQQAFESGETASSGIETEREQEREQIHNGNENTSLLEQMRSEIQYLRGELTAQREQHAQETTRRDEADGEFRRLLLRQDAEIARLQQENRLLLATPIVEELTPAVQEPPPVPPGSPETHSETGAGYQDGVKGQEAQGNVQSPQEERKWYQFWKR